MKQVQPQKSEGQRRGNSPHTEYCLTELGKSLGSVICGLGRWAQENMQGVLEAREAYDSGGA